uniref:hypothetical protein n=1 Tax=Faecalibacterium sp. TaxID=1971605 RepID=UPI003FF0763D
TLSTEFSTFNFCFAHPPWKEKQLQPFPQAFHTAFTSRWKTTEPHHSTHFPTFPHLPQPLLRILQQVQYRFGGFVPVLWEKEPQNLNPK